MTCACGQLVVEPNETPSQKGQLALCPEMSLLLRWLGVGAEGWDSAEIRDCVSNSRWDIGDGKVMPESKVVEARIAPSIAGTSFHGAPRGISTPPLVAQCPTPVCLVSCLEMVIVT